MTGTAQNKKADVSGGSQKPFYVSVTLINKEKRRYSQLVRLAMS